MTTSEAEAEIAVAPQEQADWRRANWAPGDTNRGRESPACLCLMFTIGLVRGGINGSDSEY